MKYLLLSAFFFITFWASAQVVPPVVPIGFSYQAVARQANGQPYVSTPVTVQFTVIQGSTSGSQVWIEEQAVTTNTYGLFNATVGLGTRTNGTATNFSDIDWAKGPYFLRTDLKQGANTTFVSTNQLLSVPFAQVAGKAPWTDYAVYEHQTPFGTGGGGPTGDFTTRVLNKTLVEKGTSISKPAGGNQITLQPGVYKVEFQAAAYGNIGHHFTYLYNNSDNVTVLRSLNQVIGGAYDITSTTECKGIVTVTGTAKSFELRTMVGNWHNASSTLGFGVDPSFIDQPGTAQLTNVHVSIQIQKID